MWITALSNLSSLMTSTNDNAFASEHIDHLKLFDYKLLMVGIQFLQVLYKLHAAILT